jgi:septal ring factor EnvC (AmiA/AmiB activator)
MRRIWILVIVLGVATALFLGYLYIPPVKAWLTNIGIVAWAQDTISGGSDAINSLNPSSLLSVLFTSVGGLGFIIRNQLAKRREDQITLSNVRVMAQEKEGMLRATFDDAKELLTGNISELKEEYATLEGEVTTLKETIGSKDDKIMAVQDELNRVQAELNSEKDKLLEVTKQMDEYRIALKEKEKPTLN